MTLTASVSDSTMAGPADADDLFLLDQLPFSLRADSATDIGGIHRVSPIKIQIDSPKPLPRTSQYPMYKEALQGPKPIIEDYKAQGLRNSPSVPVIPLFHP